MFKLVVPAALLLALTMGCDAATQTGAEIVQTGKSAIRSGSEIDWDGFLVHFDFWATDQTKDEPTTAAAEPASEPDQGQTPVAGEQQDPSIPRRVMRSVKMFVWTEWRAASSQAVPLDVAEVERWVVHYTNIERARVGVRPLKYDQQLSEIARAHSENMANQDALSHKIDGKGFAIRGAAITQRCLFGGAENITRYPHGHWWKGDWEGDTTSDWTSASLAENTKKVAQGMVEAWMESPEHRKNILDPR